MELGKVNINNKVILAPMSGITDRPFRLMCKEFGAGLVFTEMISAEGVARGNTQTLRYLLFDPQERPIGIQLFGNHPQVMAEAASRIQTLHPDFIDLNFGCPVTKVVRKGAGAALLKDLALLGKIAEAVVKSTDIPVTAKIRSGWGLKDNVAVPAARMLEDKGVAAITIHPRTQAQQFRGQADWGIIEQVKQSVSLPVIGNGDVKTPLDAERMLNETGCDLVMIGRGALGRPWIFREMNHYLKHKELLTSPTPKEKLDICLKHFQLAVKEKGPYYGVVEMRKHIVWYTKGMPQSNSLRAELFQLKDEHQVQAKLKQYLEFLETRKFLAYSENMLVLG